MVIYAEAAMIPDLGPHTIAQIKIAGICQLLGRFKIVGVKSFPGRKIAEGSIPPTSISIKPVIAPLNVVSALKVRIGNLYHPASINN